MIQTAIKEIIRVIMVDTLKEDLAIEILSKIGHPTILTNLNAKSVDSLVILHLIIAIGSIKNPNLLITQAQTINHPCQQWLPHLCLLIQPGIQIRV